MQSDRHPTAPEHISEVDRRLSPLWAMTGRTTVTPTVSLDRDHVTAAHTYGEWTTVKEATCTAAGQKQHTCTKCGHVETQVIPATGHHWVDNGDGTHTCPDCQVPPRASLLNTNSALELRVVDAEGMDQPFTGEPERHPAHLHRCLRHRHPYRRPGYPALPAGPWRTDHPVRHQWPDQQLRHQRPAGTGQRQRSVVTSPTVGARRAHPAAGGGSPPANWRKASPNPGGGVYRKAPLASLLQKPPARSASVPGAFFWLWAGFPLSKPLRHA